MGYRAHAYGAGDVHPDRGLLGARGRRAGQPPADGSAGGEPHAAGRRRAGRLRRLVRRSRLADHPLRLGLRRRRRCRPLDGRAGHLVRVSASGHLQRERRGPRRPRRQRKRDAHDHRDAAAAAGGQAAAPRPPRQGDRSREVRRSLRGHGTAARSTGRTVRTLRRTLRTTHQRRLELALPRKARRAALRQDRRSVRARLTVRARYGDGRSTTARRTVRVRL